MATYIAYMYYDKCASSSETFSVGLSNKLMKEIELVDFMNRPCNCNNKTPVYGKCAHRGSCRQSVLVCKATCKLCDMCYIRNT